LLGWGLINGLLRSLLEEPRMTDEDFNDENI
jgi:hypothetical protein